MCVWCAGDRIPLCANVLPQRIMTNRDRFVRFFVCVGLPFDSVSCGSEHRLWTKLMLFSYNFCRIYYHCSYASRASDSSIYFHSSNSTGFAEQITENYPLSLVTFTDSEFMLNSYMVLSILFCFVFLKEKLNLFCLARRRIHAILLAPPCYFTSIHNLCVSFRFFFFVIFWALLFHFTIRLKQRQNEKSPKIEECVVCILRT